MNKKGVFITFKGILSYGNGNVSQCFLYKIMLTTVP